MPYVALSVTEFIVDVSRSLSRWETWKLTGFKLGVEDLFGGEIEHDVYFNSLNMN